MGTPDADGLVIRRATPDDAAAHARIMSDPDVFPGLLQMPFGDVAAWRQRLSDVGAPGRPDVPLVGVLDGEVVATAGLFGSAPQLRRRHAVSLGISVDPAFQRRGIARRLMAALTDYADQWAGVLRIELTVWADNEHAVRLYQRHGFEIEGRLRAYALRAGRYVDALAMGRLHPNPPRWD